MCFLSLLITLCCTCGSDALMWRWWMEPRGLWYRSMGHVQGGALLSIHETCSQDRCLPNTKNMILYPLDRGFSAHRLSFLV